MATPIIPVSGLELLVPLTEVKVTQRHSIVNQYVIHTKEGQVLYNVKEDATNMDVLCGSGHDRSFTMQVFDVHDQEVFSMRRPMTWGPGKMKVILATGQLVSIIRRKRTYVKPVLYINDARDCRMFKIKADRVSQMENHFYIYCLDGTQVGVITKTWAGWRKELFTTADTFEVKFPPDLDATFKAVVISATFFIDFLIYEGK